jgi:hypothetical protein
MSVESGVTAAEAPTIAIAMAIAIAIAITVTVGSKPRVIVGGLYVRVGDYGRGHERDTRHCDSDADNGRSLRGHTICNSGYSERGAEDERCEFKHGNAP